MSARSVLVMLLMLALWLLARGDASWALQKEMTHWRRRRVAIGEERGA